MRRQISFRQYRLIDLTILAVVLGVSQYVIHRACSQWYPEQLYVVSPVAAVTALVMMRWNGCGAVHALVGGVVFTALSGGTPEQYLIYSLGNLLGLGGLIFFKLFGKERVRQDSFLTVMFGLTVQLLMQLGRAGVAGLLGYPWAACLGFLTTDALSDLFTLFLLWIIRRVDGLFEDQKAYLLRVQEQQ